MSSGQPAKVPVFTQYGMLEMADAARVRQLHDAPNAVFVRRHKDGRLMRILLGSYGDDYALQSHRGNPQTEVHDAETETNPRGVWAFKRYCGSDAGKPQ